MDIAELFTSVRQLLGLDTTYELSLFLVLCVMAVTALVLHITKGFLADKLAYYMGVGIFFVFIVMSIAPLVLIQT